MSSRYCPFIKSYCKNGGSIGLCVFYRDGQCRFVAVLSEFLEGANPRSKGVEGMSDYIAEVNYGQCDKGKVIRCRDCAYSGNYTTDDFKVCYQSIAEPRVVASDGFCGLGKLRDNYVAKLDFSNKHNTCDYPNAHGQVL